MRLSYRFGGVALGVMLGVLACSGSGEPNDDRCEQPLTFEVSSGLTPTFSWTPVCTVAQLRVVDPADGEEMWSVLADNNSVTPGVVYGETPIGALQTKVPEQLTSGTQYRVVVAIDNADGLLVHGSAVFTPTN